MKWYFNQKITCVPLKFHYVHAQYQTFKIFHSNEIDTIQNFKFYLKFSTKLLLLWNFPFSKNKNDEKIRLENFINLLFFTLDNFIIFKIFHVKHSSIKSSMLRIIKLSIPKNMTHLKLSLWNFPVFLLIKSTWSWSSGIGNFTLKDHNF